MDFSKLFSLEGKVALVTGAAYGIGFSIAEAYAKAGAKIAFNCRSQHHMDQALADYKAKGIDAKGYICDVTDEEQVKNMVADIEKELGVIDILVNNAGIIKRIPMTEMSVEDFKQVIDIDLNAPFIVSKAVLPGMIKKGHDALVRGIVVGQLAGNAAESDVVHAVHAQQPFGSLAAGKPAAAGHAAVRRVRALHLAACDHRKHHAREQGENKYKIIGKIHIDSFLIGLTGARRARNTSRKRRFS